MNAAVSAPVAAEGDAAYPELLRDLAGIVKHELLQCGLDIEAEQAEAVSLNVAETVREHFGGQVIYVPKGAAFKTKQRWEQMWTEFTGHNHADLARRYGMGVHGVYRVLAIMRAEHRRRAQPDLFQTPSNPD